MQLIDQLNHLKNKLTEKQKDMITTAISAVVFLLVVVEFTGTLSTVAPLLGMLPNELLADLVKIQLALAAIAQFISNGKSAELR
ncbi:hypothetical protein ACQ4M3_09480 [Leptolyngbya sp. AN03gr2]|uniref:hypothetical protein n=1 Tax=Leptolyngbya sp. AN03gr2 TaxID=3423364 RepID=UPI003D31C2FF